GNEHPHTLTAHANLAASYRQAGRTSDAIEIEEHVLADRERLLGNEHPHTLTAHANLAASYRQAGRTSDAIEIEEHVLADRKRLLGSEHPHTLTARANLATTLSTPWRLGLTATVYHHDGNLAELLHHTTGHDLDQHLVARYISAVTANTPNPHHYQPDDVHRWLHHLTGHLAGTSTRAPATDLALHHLWPLAGTTRVRIADLLLTTLVLAPACYLATVLALALDPDFWGFESGSLPATVITVCTTFAGVIAFRPTPKPNRLRSIRETVQHGFMARLWAKFKTWFIAGFTIGFTLGFPLGLEDDIADGFLPRLVDGLVVGLVLGIGTSLISGFMGRLAGGFADGFKTWFTVVFVFVLGLVFVFVLKIGIELGLGHVIGLVGGLVGGLAGIVMRGLKGEPTAMTSPRATIRDDIVYGLLIGPLAGILAGTLAEILATDEYMFGLVIGCVVGVVVGFASGFASAARRYGVFLLCSRGKLPFRLGVFLDWAVTAGLLRYSGPGYQFRDRELQQWLNQHPHP
ncbi:MULTISPECIES: tetratricopeptide repeat protein, partial [unclassified Streptomyces]|uniref:tetratricopeptide repeat protein n=1 Tax=unclassified Streptomyces TaxID=2593676 RepID=UPI003811987E